MSNIRLKLLWNRRCICVYEIHSTQYPLDSQYIHSNFPSSNLLKFLKILNFFHGRILKLSDAFSVYCELTFGTYLSRFIYLQFWLLWLRVQPQLRLKSRPQPFLIPLGKKTASRARLIAGQIPRVSRQDNPRINLGNVTLPPTAPHTETQPPPNLKTTHLPSSCPLNNN
jgi:hypothetical protein